MKKLLFNILLKRGANQAQEWIGKTVVKTPSTPAPHDCRGRCD